MGQVALDFLNTNPSLCNILAAFITAIGIIIGSIIDKHKKRKQPALKAFKIQIANLIIYIGKFSFQGLVFGLLGTFLFWYFLVNPISQIRQAPFNVDNYFFPSGFMGEGAINAQLITINRIISGRSNDSDSNCISISYKYGTQDYAGVSWQYPDGNFGQKPGSKIVNSSQISFWVKGAHGGEIVEFYAGGNKSNKYKDTFTTQHEKYILEKEWKNYRINLQGMDLSRVITPFGWSAAKVEGATELCFFLDEIRYE